MAIKKTNSGGFVHIAAILGIAVTLGLVSWFVYTQVKHQQAVSAERKLYAQADKEAQAYITAIEREYPGKVIHDNSCSISSAKYSKGLLGCNVETSINIILDENDTEYRALSVANNNLSLLGWGVPEDGTSGNKKYTSSNYLKSLIYKTEGLTCGVHYKYDEEYKGAGKYELTLSNGHKILNITAECSGSALAEYY